MNENKMGQSSLGMDENLAALLSYVFGFISGILFFALEKDSRFVKFHAMQSILFSVGWFILVFIIGFIPVIGWIASMLLAPIGLIIWIVFLVKAYKGEYFKFPVIGDIAEQQIADMNQPSAHL